MRNSGKKPYAIEYDKRVIKHDIKKLDSQIRERIRRVIESKLTADPVRAGKPLQNSPVGDRRLRVGNYRITYEIDMKNDIVTIRAIGHHSTIYKR